MGLLLCDGAETLRAVLGPGVCAHHVRARDLPADDRAIWQAFSDAEAVHVYEDAFPGTGWERLVVVDRAPRSQFDVLREGAGRDFPLDAPLACVALEGRDFHGHRGRAWAAHRGNLHLSVALAPGLPAPTHGLAFTMLPSLAVADAIEDLAGGRVAAGIKWVNDVLLDGRKVSGVLTATQTGGTTLDLVVMGAGVNIASAPVLPPSPFVSAAACLADEASGAAPTLATLLPAVLAALAGRYEALCRTGPTPLFEAYRERSVVIGRDVRIYAEGLALDTDPAAWPEPLVAGRVTDLAEDLSLGLAGHAERVRTGRLAFEEACRAFGLPA